MRRILCAACGGLAAALTLAPNDPSFFFSPYAWQVAANASTTVNTGSYFRILISATSVNLTFDVSQMVAPTSQIYWHIDNGPMTMVPVASVVPLTIQPNLLKGDVPYHTLEVIVKSTTERANRWATGVPSTRVVFTGLQLSAGAAVAAIFPAPRNILIYGDSITEGGGSWISRLLHAGGSPIFLFFAVLTLGGSQPDDTDHNDATVCWSFRLGPLLGAETGVIGFGATGLSRGGSGGVPALGVSWNQLWDGVPRSFDPRPDLIVLNEGTNDGAANIVAAMTAVLNSLLTAAPGTPIAVLRPFNGAEAANLQAAIAASANPGLCHYIDTTGFYDETYGGNLHPTGPNDVARIAPQVAKQLRPLLA